MSVPVPTDVRPLFEELGKLAARHHVRVYAVGGCVRDWCLGIKQGVDVDVTVEGEGVAFAQIVVQNLGGTLRVHPPFGTATIHVSERSLLDIASCRKETYARPAAYPSVSAGTLKDDLMRRDFTINAMALSLQSGHFGTLIDLFDGRGDLKRKQLRVLHPGSFLDDPSRILRGIRFSQRFGLSWEAETDRHRREAIRAGALGWLNAGRLQKELERMCEEPDPAACLEQLAAFLENDPRCLTC